MFARVLATWFGCGLVPKAPGTFGSIGALVFAIPFLNLPPWAFAVAALILSPVAIWSSTVTANQLNRKDPQIVVIDEVEGQWLTLAGSTHLNWKALALGLLFFRIFDIWKPWPVRSLEKLPDGWGIVLDDCMAGVYAGLVLFACGWFNFY